MKINKVPRPPQIGDIVSVYTVGVGPGSQGLTGMIIAITDKNLYLGLYPAGTPPIQALQGRVAKKVVAIATIPFLQITTIIQRLV